MLENPKKLIFSQLYSSLEPKPKFRNFLLFLIDRISSKYPEFSNDTLDEKTYKIQRISQEAENSILALFTNYSYKSMLGDLCSDILYNIKPERFEKETKENLKIPMYLSFFLDFTSISIYECNLIKISLNDEKKPSILMKILNFMEKELISEKTISIIRDYIIQITNLPIPLINFIMNFNQLITQYEVLDEKTGEKLDVYIQFSRIHAFLMRLMCEENLQILNILEKRSLFDVFYSDIGLGFHSDFLPIFCFIRNLDRNHIETRLLTIFSSHKYHESLIKSCMRLKPSSYMSFFESIEFLKANDCHLQDFSKDIMHYIKLLIDYYESLYDENIENEHIFRNLIEIAEYINRSSFDIHGKIIENYEVFSMNCYIYRHFLIKNQKIHVINHILTIFLSSVAKLPEPYKTNVFLPIIIESIDFLNLQSFELALTLIFYVFSDKTSNKSSMDSVFYEFFKKITYFDMMNQMSLIIPMSTTTISMYTYEEKLEKKVFLLKNMIKLCEFSSDLLKNNEKPFLFMLDLLENCDSSSEIMKNSKYSEFFIVLLELCIRSRLQCLKTLKEKGIIQHIFKKDVKILRNFKEFIAFVFHMEGLSEANSLSFYDQLFYIELKLLKNIIIESLKSGNIFEKTQFESIAKTVATEDFSLKPENISENTTTENTDFSTCFKDIFEKIELFLEIFNEILIASRKSADIYRKNANFSVFQDIFSSFLNTPFHARLFSMIKNFLMNFPPLKRLWEKSLKTSQFTQICSKSLKIGINPLYPFMELAIHEDRLISPKTLAVYIRSIKNSEETNKFLLNLNNLINHDISNAIALM